MGPVLIFLLSLIGIQHEFHVPSSEIASGGSCNGLHVTDGSVSCRSYGQGQTCHVFCDGKDQGEFTCGKDGEWRNLPPCAKPIEDEDDYDYTEPRAETGGCPNRNECVRTCKRNGNRNGVCTGQGDIYCMCVN